jgi:site-specific DNA-methyltransferase (adenine-specific)
MIKKYENTIFEDDNINILRNLPSNIVDLICIDPPYNISKDYWDIFKTKEEYLLFIIERIKESIRVLKPNGSFYIFHNDYLVLNEIVNLILKETTLEFKQFITWNKRFKDSKNKGFLDGYVCLTANKNYQKMAEYIVYFTNTEYKKDLNEYFQLLGKSIGGTKKINEFYGHRKYENCFVDIDKPYWYLMNEELYNQLFQDFKTKLESFNKREYKELKTLTYNNQNNSHSVWDYDIASKEIHITPKPIDLLKNIILHSSDENDLCMDYFAGTGSFGKACVQTNRKYILIERDKNYIEYINKELKNKLFEF